MILPAPRHTALGTADWFQFPSGVKPTFQTGDIWLSRLPAGEAVGFRDDRHILVVSGTRSGKGASVIVPNLCLWAGSAVVIDPKGENAFLTARRRGGGSAYAEGLGQAVHILDPFGEVATRYDDFADLKASFNPLDIIRLRPLDAVDEAARMAESFIISEGSGDAFFDDAARAVIKALILHVASYRHIGGEARNLLTLRRLLVAGDETLVHLAELNDGDAAPSGMSLLFKAMRDNPAYGGIIARMGAMLHDLLETSPRTLMSFMQVARTDTEFLDSPALQTCLAHSSFNLADLKHKRLSLYLCLPQRYMDSHYRWLRLMVTLILGEMERVQTIAPMPHPILMVLDEFAALRRMKVIENAAAQIAGYGVKLMFVVQTLAQLKDVYRDNWETLVANAGVKLFFGNDDHFTREYASKLMGETEITRWAASVTETQGSSQSRGIGMNTGVSGSKTLGTSSSFGMSGNNFNTSSGKSYSDTSGWSKGQTTSFNHGTSRSITRGGSDTFHKRNLLNPDEIGRLFGNRQNPAMLALISGMQPLALERSLYFADPMFTGKHDPHKDHTPPITLAVRREAALAAARSQFAAEQRESKPFRHEALEKLLAEATAKAAKEKQEREARQIAHDARIRRIKALTRVALRLGFFVALAVLAYSHEPARTIVWAAFMGF